MTKGPQGVCCSLAGEMEISAGLSRHSEEGGCPVCVCRALPSQCLRQGRKPRDDHQWTGGPSARE